MGIPQIPGEDAEVTLLSEFFGGPLDGRRTADWPPPLSGRSLRGMVARSPLTQPAHLSTYAVYRCVSEMQVNGYWRFEYVGLEGSPGSRSSGN